MFNKTEETTGLNKKIDFCDGLMRGTKMSLLTLYVSPYLVRKEFGVRNDCSPDSVQHTYTLINEIGFLISFLGGAAVTYYVMNNNMFDQTTNDSILGITNLLSLTYEAIRWKRTQNSTKERTLESKLPPNTS